MRPTPARPGRVERMLRSAWAKPSLFGAALLPLAWLMWQAASSGLGPNPAEYLIRSTGEWALRFLCLVLLLTPLRTWTGWASLARLRRMVGLFCFFYVCVHLTSYAWLDMEWVLEDIALDIPKRPFILVGFAAWVMLSALAATSFNRAVRALGAVRWRALHRLVYVVAPLAILHFFWMRAAKQRFEEVWFYGLLLAVLLGWRVMRRWSSTRSAGAPG